MRQSFFKIFSFAIAFCIMFSACIFAAETFDGDIANIISYKEKSCSAKNIGELIDKDFSVNAGNGGELYIIALARLSSEEDFSGYAKNLASYLSNERYVFPVTGEKYALVFLSLGIKSRYIEYAANNFIGNGGLMSFVYGLHLLNNGAECEKYTPLSLAEKIISFLNADGGFSVTGSSSDIDVTSMAITALAPFYSKNDNVKKAVDSSLLFISKNQLESGGFSSYGVENCESAAQVITALCALNIDPETDERFIKNGNTAVDSMISFKRGDGSFSHVLGGEENGMATEQAFFALCSLKCFENGENPLFLFGNTEDRTPSDFEDVTFGGEEIHENPEKRADIKKTVCISVISVSVFIIVILLIPKKKKQNDREK